MTLGNEKIKYKDCSPNVLKDFNNLNEMSKIKTINELEDYLKWHDWIIDFDFDYKNNELIVGLNNYYWWIIYSFKENLIKLY